MILSQVIFDLISELAMQINIHIAQEYVNAVKN